ncbi:MULTISPECIES: recombinase family protein [Cyclobacteriaceae]|jgi:Site-specific recombinases, DNA invertase Pin homologs|uniref:Site-specific recombinase, DNA invertase Pin n=2 Tax=Cyclobacteriaceae TaxID=563798 RepID=L0G224_ECHVK|nr:MULTISPECIES: recombinase family protein [Cyclobacteriaceae]AGA79373.1 site-specific recombinase, DNA invertase Pin [Echinicola vietnamensis DSM 17526]MBB6325433.1 DNA invertase Pin-like site-specific DNA recombinase [Algoriphagus iocasae]MBD3630423.1 recombinase family protein [Cyclobacterium sp.]
MSVERGKRADLYVRVSTDEQADKGYSQRNQEEMLRKYCDNHWIEIRNIVYEDHSAKSFNRPEWKKLLSYLKKHRGKIDLVLFTKWDRFSRNAGDAYQMINVLRDFGVEPQAIEQPLDLSIPENKMMLAFYLAAPEVENDRRALNVFYGMRRAKKEGRYMGLAPVGYKNKIDQGGHKYIAPKEPDATILYWAFEELSKGVFNTEQVWKNAREKGLQCSKNAFWQLIRNPVYCGKIFLPKFKDEESRFIQGQHQAIISEELFDKVQEILDGRGRKYRPKINTRNDFPLRGFLICPVCGSLLTASRSKGRTNHYSYYHCRKGCPYRIRVEELHQVFEGELRKFIPRKEMSAIYRKIIAEAYYELTQNEQKIKKQLLHQLKDYENRVSHIRNLLAMQKIEPTDYLEIKRQYDSVLTGLKEKLDNICRSLPKIESLLEKDIMELMALDSIFEESKTEDKRSLIHTIYPQKLLFYGTLAEEVKPDDILTLAYHYNTEKTK